LAANGSSAEGDRVTTPTDVKVLSTTAMKAVFDELSPLFERVSGHRIAAHFGPSTQLEKRLGEGETADVAIVTMAGLKDLIARGKIVSGSLVELARSTLGIAVQKGAPKPDISSVDAFNRALLAAKAVAMSKPVGGGQSGAHMAKVFEQLGITAAMAAKAKYGEGGAKGLAGFVLVRGEADLGIQQMAELMAVPGIDIVGPLPAEVQSITLFTAGIPVGASYADAGRTLIAFLTTPEAKRVITAKGLDPA
jgi:molybdate transport system substrate-binding protein